MLEINRVVLEQGKEKTFATAIDWPGWSRSGNSGDDAMRVLAEYTGRYQVIADMAGVVGFDEASSSLVVVDTLTGNSTTDFGAPDKISAIDHEPMSTDECERQLALLQACWTFFDEIAARVSAELRDEPLGGGRDRDEIRKSVV